MAYVLALSGPGYKEDWKAIVYFQLWLVARINQVPITTTPTFPRFQRIPTLALPIYTI